jgi:hypothetical protein
LIDEYEFVVQPRLAGHGPTLFAGLSKHIDFKLVSRLEFRSGAVAMRYEPRTWPSGLLARVGRVGPKDTDPCLTVVTNLAAALEIPPGGLTSGHAESWRGILFGSALRRAT